MKNWFNKLRDYLDQMMEESTHRAHAAALGYSYDEVWAMGITCAQVGLHVDGVMDIALKSAERVEDDTRI